MIFFTELIFRLSLIVTVGFLSNYFYENYYSNRKLNLYIQSVIFIVITIFSMSTPIIIQKNFNFDARSITILVPTLFYGLPVGLPTAVSAFLYRIYISQGQLNIISSGSTILIPFLIGYLFYILNKNKKVKISLLSLYLIGVFNSVLIFIFLFFFMPLSISLTKFLEVQQIAILIYPVFTTILGLVIKSGMDKVTLNKKIFESEAKLKAVFHSIKDIIIILDSNGKILNVNQAFKSIFPSNNDSLKSKIFSDYFKMYDIDSNKEFLLNFNSNEIIIDNPFNKSDILVEFNGIKIPFRISFNQILTNENIPLGYALTMQDLRDELKSKQELQLSEKTFRGLFNSIQEAIYIMDGNGNFLDVNNGAARMLGYDKSQIIGKNPVHFSVDEKNKNIILSDLIHKAHNGEQQVFEFWGKKNDGTIFPQIVCLYQGEYFGKKVVIAVGIDITPIKKAEEEKQIMLNKLFQIIENFDSGIILESSSGKIEFINHKLIRLFNFKNKKDYFLSIDSKELFDLLKERFVKPEYFLNTLESCVNSKNPVPNLEFSLTDNRIIEIGYFPILYQNELINKLWIIDDITERKGYEKKLKSNISELERFNKVLIDRELKMIELKQEINDLLIRLGLPAKYKTTENS